MGSTARLATSLLAGLALGVASAQFMASPSNPMISERHGNWHSWPGAGDPVSSPYSQARFLLAGHLPEHFSEVTTLYRSEDDDGGNISGSCVYLLSLKRPGVRRWSVTIVDDGKSPGAGSSVLTQDDVFSRDGTVEIRLAALPQPGNWLPMPEDAAPLLVLRLYDGEERDPQAELDSSLPALTLEGCP